MAFINLKAGEVLICKGVEYELGEPIDEKSMLAVRLSTGQKEVVKISDLQPLTASAGGRRQELARISAETWQVAKDRFKAIKPLLNAPRHTLAAYVIQSEKANVHPATLYRWRTRFLKTGLLEALLPDRKGPKPGRRRLNPAVEAVIAATIDELYLTAQKGSPRAVHEEIQTRCRNAKLHPPHYNTVRARIAHIADAKKLGKRSGYKAAENLYTPNEGSITAEFPLAIVQMDHTLLDIVLVDDESRMPIGRPWITICFDVFSRMVTGFYISLDPPGAMSAGLCLSRSILRKDSWLMKLGLDTQWPCWGLPATLHIDNAREFRGDMLKRACDQYGIEIEWRPVARPNWGGHIERNMLNLARELKKVPGATFSNPRERGNYDSDATAALTITELERYLATYICQKYHNQVHSSLGVSPLDAWKVGIFGGRNQPGRGLPRMVANEDRFKMDFMPFEERTVNDYGVLMDGIHYFADVLRPYVNSRLPGRYRVRRQFLFRRDPRDISQVYFWDENNAQYHVIPYRNTSRPAISLWELKAAKRYLDGRGERSESEDEIFGAIASLRSMVQESVKETKKMRRDRQRKTIHKAAHSRKAQTPSDLPDRGDTVDTDSSDIKPFDDIELR